MKSYPKVPVCPATADLFGEPAHCASPGWGLTLEQESPAPSNAWSSNALSVAVGRQRHKELTKAQADTLSNAMWVYSQARENALASPCSAQNAASRLLGHRSLQDVLNLALRVLDSHLINAVDIPAPWDVGQQDSLNEVVAAAPVPSLDLRHLAVSGPIDPVSRAKQEVLA